jgi:hypothetical protein
LAKALTETSPLPFLLSPSSPVSVLVVVSTFLRRYTVDIQLKEVVSDAKMADPEERIAARKDLKKVFETK